MVTLALTPTPSPGPFRPAVTPSPPPSATRQPLAASFLGQVSLPNATVHYYRISGTTAADLRTALDANNLLDEAGDRGDALTRWYISWHWPGYGLPFCALRAARVAYHIRVTLPRWTPPPEAAPALRDQWAAYLEALAWHERGHVDNIVSHYREVETAIRASTCRTADASAQAVVAILRAFDVAYDDATDHGATQGAVFP